MISFPHGVNVPEKPRDGGAQTRGLEVVDGQRELLKNQPVDGGEQVGGPGPVVGQAQPHLAGAAHEAASYVEQPVAQGAWLGDGQLTVPLAAIVMPDGAPFRLSTTASGELTGTLNVSAVPTLPLTVTALTTGALAVVPVNAASNAAALGVPKPVTST